MKYNITIPKAPAYWISPHGVLLPLYGNENHIGQVIKKPKAFGLTIDEIQRLYDAEEETLGVEGKAREKIIKQLIPQGWIRIRRYIKQDSFTVNVCDMTDKNKNFLSQWSRAMKDAGLQYSSVNLDLPSRVISTSINDLQKQLIQDSEDDILKVVNYAEEL